MRVAGLAKSISQLSRAKLSSFSQFSTVAAQTIHVTFVDRDGNRARVPALVGHTLLDVARQYKVDLEGSCSNMGASVEEPRTANWTEYVYGEGPICFQCHVQIPSSFNHLLPHASLAEKAGLSETWEEEYQERTSRLACNITLDHKHDGLVVLVPDAAPVDCV